MLNELATSLKYMFLVEKKALYYEYHIFFRRKFIVKLSVHEKSSRVM